MRRNAPVARFPVPLGVQQRASREARKVKRGAGRKLNDLKPYGIEALYARH